MRLVRRISLKALRRDPFRIGLSELGVYDHHLTHIDMQVLCNICDAIAVLQLFDGPFPMLLGQAILGSDRAPKVVGMAEFLQWRQQERPGARGHLLCGERSGTFDCHIPGS
jgi:hypothetical protein